MGFEPKTETGYAYKAGLCPDAGSFSVSSPSCASFHLQNEKGEIPDFLPVVTVSMTNFRYYSQDLGRWLSRDPIEDIVMFNIYKIRAKYYATILVNIDYVFVHNKSVDNMDSHGLFENGGIKCNKDCKMEITGCDTWPTALRPCCEKHESVHLGQVGENFCKKVKDKNGVECCPDEGKSPSFETDGMKGIKQWPDGECPAYAASITCFDSLLGANLSIDDRKAALRQVQGECKKVKDKCPKDQVPDVCNNFQ